MALSILDGNQSATTLSTILSGGQHITAHTVVSLGTQAITDMRGAVSGSVVSISNFPASQVISGTVTANPTGTQTIAGTVTANVPFASTTATFPSQLVALGFQDVNTGNIVPVNNDAEAGLPAFVRNISVEANPSAVFPNWLDGNTPIDVPISGTVTIGSVPNGTLTTRFGSIATANTAFSTTAVTNTSRKYLMIQNIASTVITAGIGFIPTTTQGIQIVAGATITFDGNYIPTGAVRILSSVTASNFTVLEA
jgi:hypothetical protein